MGVGWQKEEMAQKTTGVCLELPLFCKGREFPLPEGEECCSKHFSKLMGFAFKSFLIKPALQLLILWSQCLTLPCLAPHPSPPIPMPYSMALTFCLSPCPDMLSSSHPPAPILGFYLYTSCTITTHVHCCVRKLARSDTGGPTLTRGLAKSPLITLMFTSRKDNNCILLSNSRHLHKHWKLHTNYYYCVQLCMQFPESISSHWGWKYKLWFPEWIKMTISVKTFHRRNFVFLNFLPSSNTRLPFCNIFFFFLSYL